MCLRGLAAGRPRPASTRLEIRRLVNASRSTSVWPWNWLDNTTNARLTSTRGPRDSRDRLADITRGVHIPGVAIHSCFAMPCLHRTLVTAPSSIQNDSYDLVQLNVAFLPRCVCEAIHIRKNNCTMTRRRRPKDCRSVGGGGAERKWPRCGGRFGEHDRLWDAEAPQSSGWMRRPKQTGRRRIYAGHLGTPM